MAQSLIACPLCSTASFSNSSTLCLSLINVASKWIRCTMCDEELRGLDKFTIHLLSHLIHTPSFKRFLINSGQLSDTPLCFNSQPLNLVKSHNGQKDDHSLLQTLPVDIDQQSVQKESKCERPSLKIDDEVMIFFNDNSLNENLEINKNETAVVKALDEVKPSSSGLPKFTINFNMENRNQHENISDSEKKGVTPNKNYMEANSRNDSLQYIYPMGTNVQGSSNENVLVQNHELQMEFNDGNKVKDVHISLPVTENILDMATDSSCASTQTESQLGNKSSYLSPKGERVLGYRCDICSLVFPDEHILTMHRQLIHIELNKGKSEPMSYKCHLCSKSFVMKGSLMVHMRVAHFGGAVVARLVEAKQLETDAVSPDSAQFICSVCNKGFQKEQQLAQHEKLHDRKQCEVCLKTFTTKYFLRKHKRLHTGEMPYQCGQCNKSFTFQQSYHKHLLYHSDDKPYTCSDCGRAFKELSTLHNHQRIHTGEKPFSCETCELLVVIVF